MIMIERVSAVAKQDLATLAPYAMQEIAVKNADVILANTKDLWVFRDEGEPCLIAGLFCQSMMGNDPEFWILLCDAFNAYKHYRAAKYYSSLLRSNYPRVKVLVEEDFKQGQHFAYKCGFQAVGGVMERGGVNYKVYRARVQ